MGLFSYLFGKPKQSGRSVVGTPEDTARAVDRQRQYWTPDPREEAELFARVDALSWPELLRLHHLICARRVAEPSPGVGDDALRLTLARLGGETSPYRPRVAMVWRGTPSGVDDRPPDSQGRILNASLSHLGCLEVFRVGPDDKPAELGFVAFDELAGVLFGPPALIRAAKLFYEDRRTEVVYVPLLYGTTWQVGSDDDRAGRMTCFVAHLDDTGLSNFGVTGVGVGQHDFTAIDGKGASLFGLGSVAELAFPLDANDPDFERKARVRGMKT